MTIEYTGEDSIVVLKDGHTIARCNDLNPVGAERLTSFCRPVTQDEATEVVALVANATIKAG